MRRVTLFFFVLLISTTFALSHNWYDYDCCSDKDCAPAKDVKYKDDGTIIVQIELQGRTYIITYPPDFPKDKIRSSKDEKIHGCAFVGRPIPEPLCLYLPAGA